MEERAAVEGDLVWYCVRSLNKQEAAAARMTQVRLGVDTFAPQRILTRRTQTGKKRFREPLFPCYFFAQLDLICHRRQVESFPGVRSLVHFGQHYPRLPAAAIEALRQEMRGDVIEIPEAEITPGSAVVVTDGPFRNLRALVTSSLPGDTRVGLLFDFLGQEIQIDFPRANLLRDDR